MAATDERLLHGRGGGQGAEAGAVAARAASAAAGRPDGGGGNQPSTAAREGAARTEQGREDGGGATANGQGSSVGRRSPSLDGRSDRRTRRLASAAAAGGGRPCLAARARRRGGGQPGRGVGWTNGTAGRTVAAATGDDGRARRRGDCGEAGWWRWLRGSWVVAVEQRQQQASAVGGDWARGRGSGTRRETGGGWADEGQHLHAAPAALGGRGGNERRRGSVGVEPGW
ncbi:uncharacterized protein LOC130139510 [Syzygium oleosum]|uniref:uncharacterized protein LOC130139510 n=1 Tax=Syzygium oleosum TaxID=219896 RepID=UPI0024BABC8B|nr:uncharacterized protein LOC130139510 [Syzygium oleosum]